MRGRAPLWFCYELENTCNGRQLPAVVHARTLANPMQSHFAGLKALLHSGRSARRKDKSMRLIRLCPVFLVILPWSAFAQEAGPAQQVAAAADLWLVRSQTVTEDLIKDAVDFTPSGRALLWARLAQGWSRDDPERARSWILKAIEIAEAVPNKENPAERNLRLNTTRLLLNIIAPLGQKLSKRLVAILSDDAEHTDPAERAANAEGLIEAAMSLVDKDPQRAAELGALALRIGRPTAVAWLISRLRAKDARLGDALFAQTLEVGWQTFDSELINSLSHMVFLESMQPGNPMPALPDEMRTELLKLDLAFLQANPINAENRDRTCISIVSFIAPVLGHFQRLMPQQEAVARQAVNRCQSKYPFERQRLDETLNDHVPKTVEDLLKVADDAEDLTLRTYYSYRAAALAKEKGDFERALKILDSMSTEGRELMSGSWEAYRVQWAVLLALRHYKHGDVYAMRLVMNNVPADLQPLARIGFIWDLPETRNKETDPTLEFLNDARTGLRRSKISDAEKWSYYFALLKLTVKYQPAEATAALKDAVAALNRLEQPKKDSGNEKPDSLDGGGFSQVFPASLLDMDEYAVKEAVSSITLLEARVQVRLALLEVCLERMRNLKQARPHAKQPVSKKE